MVKYKILITSLIVLLVDQIIKYFARTQLDSISVIENIFHLTLVENHGAGFGILQGKTLILILISLIVLALLIYYSKKAETKQQIPLGLVIGGLAGNLIDRLYLGYVVDYLDFRIWPVFNTADSALTVGIVWLAVLIIIEKKK